MIILHYSLNAAPRVRLAGPVGPNGPHGRQRLALSCSRLAPYHNPAMSAADVLILLLLIARAYLRLLFIRLLKLLLRAFLSVHFFLEAHWLLVDYL